MAGATSNGTPYDPDVCRMCGSADSEPVARGPIVPLVVCRSCGLMRQGRATARPELVDFAGGRERYLQQRLQKEKTQLADYARIFPVLEGILPEKGELLEIGCATGVLLEKARSRGWSCTGLEPEEWSGRLAAEKGLEVHRALLQEAPFSPESFDAILLLHVIEHLPDPVEGIRAATRLLRPGGVLVLETPRYDTIWFKMLKGRERSVIPGHLYYFTRATLRALAEKVGLSVVREDSVGRTLTLDRLCYSVAKVLHSKTATRALTGLSRGMRFEKMRVHLNLRDMVRVYLRKPAAG